MQATLPQLNNKDAKRIKADNSLSDLFDGQGWAHNIVNGNLIQTAVKDIVAAGPDCKMPSASTLSGTILERQYAADKDEDIRILGLPGVKKYGANRSTSTMPLTLTSLPRLVLKRAQ